MKIKHSWQKEEIKKLFNTVETCKKNNLSLTHAFSEYAKISGRKKNSVRNYYYEELSNLKSDESRVKELGINLQLHNISQTNNFSELETEKLIKEILKLKCLGNSIRKCCYILANGDINLMVRYQNKYRTVLKNNPKLISLKLEELRTEGLNSNINNKKLDNLIHFKKPVEKTIDEKDINSLFLGLIKLVKKSAAESVEKKLIAELDFANSSLRKSLVKNSRLEQEINEIKTQNENLILEVEKFKCENRYLKSEIANFINKRKQKQRTLATFINEVKSKQKQLVKKIALKQ